MDPKMTAGGACASPAKPNEEMTSKFKLKNVQIALMSMRTIRAHAEALGSIFGLQVETNGDALFFRDGSDLSAENERVITPDILRDMFKETIEKGENRTVIKWAIHHKILRSGNFEVV